MKRFLSLVLILALLLPAVSGCAADQEEEAAHPTAEPVAGEVNPAEEETEEIDPFEGFDYDGRTFMIHTSANSATVGVQSSNYLIQGPEEVTGDVAPDAALQRNNDVMRRLNIDLGYEQVNYSYDQVASNIRTLLQSGDATYQLIINDIYGLAPITPEGLFHNAYDGENFDFDQPWWYEDFMEDISIKTSMRFMLAGDYFIDLMRCTPCIIMNKNLYTDLYGDPDDVYSSVLEHTWTFDKFRELIEGAYKDLNGNGVKDKNDQYGHIAFQFWGPMIPWLISGDPGFIDRDENGFPIIALNNERSYLLTEKLNAILNNDATAINVLGGSEQGTIDVFTEGRSLFIGYQRLGSLESDSLRTTETDLAILPYPMLDEMQEDYVTSTHDTAELGFIPIATPYEDLSFVSAVIEVLCRETYKQVLPAYYESSLKIKYTRDNTAAQMIDIIHDHYGNGFALAWSNGLSGYLLNATFCACIENNSTDFASKNKSLEKVANKQLEKIIEKIVKLEEERGN